MKLAAKSILLLFLMLVAGCRQHQSARTSWEYEKSDNSGAIALSYRCSKIQLESGDVLELELDVALPISSSLPVVDLGISDFRVVSESMLPTMLADDNKLVRRYQWTLQAISSIKQVTNSVTITSIDENITNTVRLQHAPISVTSVFMNDEDPMKLPSPVTIPIEIQQ